MLAEVCRTWLSMEIKLEEVSSHMLDWAIDWDFKCSPVIMDELPLTMHDAARLIISKWALGRQLVRGKG